MSGELLQAEISEPCVYGVADRFCILFWKTEKEEKTLDPVGRCVGAGPGV